MEPDYQIFLRRSGPTVRKRSLYRVLLLGGGCMLIAVALGCCFRRKLSSEPPPPAPSPAAPGARAPTPSAFERMAFPTDRDILADRSQPGVFMPTSPERPASALFGSVRTAGSRQGEVASFHEGVDIAPVRRDRRGQPLDSIFAVADGKVAHVNRVSGNSSYGQYVVLLHNDPVGAAFSLYAHLSAVAGDIKVGRTVAAGAVLGTMGYTANHRIPRERAHLHIEMGLINNARFPQWFRGQKLKPDHGAYNGWNLLGVDPLDVFEKQRDTKRFTFLEYVKNIPVAFRVVLKASRRPDYFGRYPKLWEDAAFNGGVILLSCSESGLPVSGRNATDEERALLGARTAAVLNVDETVLGRNGMHIVGRANGGWVLASGSKRWLEILTY